MRTDDVIVERDSGYEVSLLNYDSATWVHKKLTAYAAQKRLWRRTPINPCCSSRPSATNKLFSHIASAARTAKLSIECLIGGSCRCYLILVSLDHGTGHLGRQLTYNPVRVEEVNERCSVFHLSNSVLVPAGVRHV